MTLGERLLGYRTDAKMSQDVLAEKVGVTRQTISKWETDQSTPEFNKILPLCEIFGITTDELIKGEKTENIVEEIHDNSTKDKRNKRKAIVISLSVFLYCIGAFSLPYMIKTLKYDEGKAILVSTTLWSIATVALIYFFLSHPKEKVQKTRKETKELDEELEEENKQTQITEMEARDKKIEGEAIGIIALFFLLSYLIISFITTAWHITWILWIVFAIVEAITKLIFDVRRQRNNEE